MRSKFLKNGLLSGICQLIDEFDTYHSRVQGRVEPTDDTLGLSFAWVSDFEAYELAILNADLVYECDDTYGVIVCMRDKDPRVVEQEFEKWKSIVKQKTYPAEVKNYDTMDSDKYVICKRV